MHARFQHRPPDPASGDRRRRLRHRAFGRATAEVEARTRRGRLETALRADHPVFAAFLASGRLTLAIGDQTSVVSLERGDLPKLRRFAELCTG